MGPDNPDILKVIISEEQLNNRIQELANQISADYQDKNLLLICVMNGSVFFCTDLIKKLSVKAEMDYITVSSYRGGVRSTGKINLIRDICIDLENYDLLVIEDILDSGRTLSYLLEHIRSKNPRSLKICSLLDKPNRRVIPVDLDYTGFVIPDVFIVGYGMDYEQCYRQLPYIGELKPEVYTKNTDKELVTKE